MSKPMEFDVVFADNSGKLVTVQNITMEHAGLILKDGTYVGINEYRTPKYPSDAIMADCDAHPNSVTNG